MSNLDGLEVPFGTPFESALQLLNELTCLELSEELGTGVEVQDEVAGSKLVDVVTGFILVIVLSMVDR